MVTLPVALAWARYVSLQGLLAVVVAVEDLAGQRRLGDGPGRLLLHVVPVVHVGHEDEREAGPLGVLTADPRVLVAGGAVEPGRVDGADAQPGVGPRVVGGVHLVGVDRRQDGGEVLPLGGDRHAAVDQRAAADAAALVDRDAAEVLGIQDAGVARDVPVDGEAEEVVERRLGPGAQPVGPVVRLARVAEDLAVGAGRVPGHAHFDHVHVDARLGEAQGGDGAAVTGADHQRGDVRPVGDRRGRRDPPGLGGGGTREGRHAQDGAGSGDEPTARDGVGDGGMVSHRCSSLSTKGERVVPGARAWVKW